MARVSPQAGPGDACRVGLPVTREKQAGAGRGALGRVRGRGLYPEGHGCCCRLTLLCPLTRGLSPPSLPEMPMARVDWPCFLMVECGWPDTPPSPRETPTLWGSVEPLRVGTELLSAGRICGDWEGRAWPHPACVSLEGERSLLALSLSPEFMAEFSHAPATDAGRWAAPECTLPGHEGSRPLLSFTCFSLWGKPGADDTLSSAPCFGQQRLKTRATRDISLFSILS